MQDELTPTPEASDPRTDPTTARRPRRPKRTSSLPEGYRWTMTVPRYARGPQVTRYRQKAIPHATWFPANRVMQRYLRETWDNVMHTIVLPLGMEPGDLPIQKEIP